MTFKINDFGDGISWEKFAAEVFERIEKDGEKFDIDDSETLDLLNRYSVGRDVLDCGCNIRNSIYAL